MDKTNCQRSFSGYVSPTESRLLKKKPKLPPDLARHQHSIIAPTVGVKTKELKEKPLGHNLAALWQRAETLGLPIGSMPGWAGTLNGLHDGPYYLRYPMGL